MVAGHDGNATAYKRFKASGNESGTELRRAAARVISRLDDSKAS